MSSEQQLSSAARYLQLIQAKKPVIIDVTAPSGFVFKRIKPSNFAILFDAGELPTSASNLAADEWQKDGLIPKTNVEEEMQPGEVAARRAIEIRDRVVANSVEPKIVFGAARARDELSYTDIDPDDLAFLYKFEASRGDYAVMAAMFPETAEQRVMAGIDGKKLRRATKQARRNTRRSNGA